MNQTLASDSNRLPMKLLLAIDTICLRFEEAWKSKGRPEIEEYLKEVDEIGQARLMQELLALDLSYRVRSGESPELEEYTSRFRDYERVIKSLFDELVLAGGVSPAVPGYEILGQLGRGGMGVVYKARQVKPPNRQLVALKMLLVGNHAGMEEIRRFGHEAEANARFQHPNIVQIFEVGSCNGLPFFSMEFMSGGSLASRLRGKPLTPREAAELVLKLAEAVSAIHECHVVHRDLKPANVLLDGAPDTPLEKCTPKVSDFGLAKHLDDVSGPTQAGQVLGTLRYMAPEQADSRLGSIGPWTDILALGAILYELLTGQPPFKASTATEELRRVLTYEPQFPQRSRSRMERDLQTICLKCLAKTPSQRYASAALVATRLRQVLNDQPIPERPPSWRDRAGRHLRRHPVAAAILLVLIGALTGIYGFAAVSRYLADPQRIREDLERRLDRGEAVTLIGETGSPGYYEWGAGADSTLISTATDRPFTVTTTKLALIEFPYAARLRSFRFTAEVRHDLGLDIGTVGIYCGRKSHAKTEKKDRFSFLCWSFGDRGSIPIVKGKAAGQARLQSFYVESWPEGLFTPTSLIKPTKGFVAAIPGFNQAPWRELSVDVSPKGMSAYWSETPGNRELVSEASIAQLQRYTDMLKSQHPALRDLSMDYFPQGGFGLFVQQGAASFRLTKLQPLTDNP